MRDDSNFDVAEIERACFVHVMTGLNNFSPPAWWPFPPGRAYALEQIRRRFGMAGVEHAKRLPIFTLH
jgi:hypothetical protein